MKRILSVSAIILLFLMAILTLTVKESYAASDQQFQFYLRDELTMAAIPSGINVTAYATIGSYITFEVPEAGLLWNASYDVLYFSFDIVNEGLGGQHREYWLLDGEENGTIWIYAGDHTYGVSGQPYTVNFYDLAGVLQDLPFVEVVAEPNAMGSQTGIIERRRLDEDLKIHCEAINGQRYNLEVKDNATSYTYGDLLFSSIGSIVLTVKGLDFPQNIILAYRYNRIYAERYDNYSSIRVTYEDTENELANVSIIIYFLNDTEAASTSYQDTTGFVYTWTSAEYTLTYTARVIITHSVYGTMNYNSILYRGGYNVSPWNFPLGTVPNMNTADIIPMFIIGGCFLLFSKINAYLSGFLAFVLSLFMCIWGWISIPSGWLMLAIVTVILLGYRYAKRRDYF